MAPPSCHQPIPKVGDPFDPDSLHPHQLALTCFSARMCIHTQIRADYLLLEIRRLAVSKRGLVSALLSQVRRGANQG